MIYVYYAPKKILMGRLLHKERQIFFEYDPDFLHLSLNLSPFKLPLQSGVIASTDSTFDGLWGVFNDSLPDGWGRLLLDRKLMRLGLKPGDLTPLDRLCFVGRGGMGALTYEPATSFLTPSQTTDLDALDHEIQSTLQEDDQYVDELLTLNGSSAGARPKVLLRIDGADWLIKFRSSLDFKDISAMEYAYHLMALEANLNLPQAKLFPSKKGSGFFGVQRFDRNPLIHMHTISGLLHADHRIPCLDYENIMKATLYLTKDTRQCEIQFRNAVFNVLSHNRDDHAKNFSFLMDENGIWRVSPAYDLTFSSGLIGEHCTTIMGEGKNPTLTHLLKLAHIGNISPSTAQAIITQVAQAIQKWSFFAQHSGVSKRTTQHIATILKRIQVHNLT